MAIKTIRKFVAEDGHEFLTVGEAQVHNMQFKRMTKLREALHGVNPGTMVLDLANDPARATIVRNALNGMLEFHRLYGKLKKKG